MSHPTAILVNPPHPAGYVSNKDSMGGFGQLYPAGAGAFPPLDIPYFAASLTEAGVPVVVLEAGALRWSLDQLCDAIGKTGSGGDAVVVVRTSLPTIDWDLEVCAAIRERCRPAKVVIYGPVVTPPL